MAVITLEFIVPVVVILSLALIHYFALFNFTFFSGIKNHHCHDRIIRYFINLLNHTELDTGIRNSRDVF